jgi:CheY-like chemotaxis protein
MPKTAKVNSVVSPVVWRRPMLPARVKTAKPLRRSARPTLLWVDDFEAGLAMYKAMFENLGYRVITACSGKSGVRLAQQHHVDVVITDYEMPEMNGEAVARAIKTIHPSLPVVMFSGSTFVPERTRDLIDAFCDKAGSRHELLATIHNLLPKKPSHSLQPLPVPLASDPAQRTVA